MNDGKNLAPHLDALARVMYGLGASGIAYPLGMDKSTNVLSMIDYQHHEIHAGSNFFIDDNVDLAINNVLGIQFTTPNTDKENHWTFNISAQAEFQWWIYENVTILTVGTINFTPFNSNRNSATTSGTTALAIANVSEAVAISYTSTIGSIRLASGRIGAGKEGGLSARSNEKVLKRNTKYLLRGKALTAGYVSFLMNWYEHTPKG